jgi:MYXO-CTERM domain-containing protein
MRTQTLRHLIGITAGLGLALGAAVPADAAPAAVLKLQDATGDVGPQDTDGGPGAEQASVTHVVRDGKVYVVTVFMSSKVEEGNWQCKCSSVELSADGSPTMAVNDVTLGPYSNGDRLCNHPKIASDGNNVFWVYGSDKNGANNPKTYVGVLDHMCNEVAEQVLISNDADNNEGAPDIQVNGDGWITAGYLSTNTNDRSVAVGLQWDGSSLNQMWRNAIVAPSNIGRPSIGAISPTRSLFCAAKGDNRPPEDGVECHVLDTMTGESLTHSLVAASQPEQGIYMNQPSVARLDFGRWALMALESNGSGKEDGGTKGSNLSHIYVLDVDDQAITTRAEQTGLGSFQTHSAICGGEYGDQETENRVIGIFGAPITGNGPPVLQIARFDTENGINQDVDNEKWIAGYYADSGKLANMYGHNPNTQGRDFLRCIGDVPNPAFGNSSGFMPSVESFFVVPHQGRTPGEPKNSQWLALIPGRTSQPLPPGPPMDAGDIELGEGGETGPTGSGPSGSGPTGGGTGGSDGAGGAASGDDGGDEDGGDDGAPVGSGSTQPADGAEPNNESSSGCACRVGEKPAGGNAALAAAFGLAIAVLSRRNRRSARKES